jgi:hypothetical protein
MSYVNAPSQHFTEVADTKNEGLNASTRVQLKYSFPHGLKGLRF